MVDELGGMIIVAVCSGCPTRNFFKTVDETARWLMGLNAPADYICLPEDRGVLVTWLEKLSGKKLAQVLDN